MKQTDSGIFLHRLSYSESSLIVRFFTLAHGTQSFMFKGAKKKKGLNLMPLSTYELSYYGTTGSLLQLTSAESEHLSLHTQYDIPKTSVAFFMAELLDQCLRDTPQDVTLFNFIQTEINWLDATSEYTNYPIWFLLEVSKHLGFYPNLEGNHNTFNLSEGMVGLPYNALPTIVTGEAIAALRDALQDTKETFLSRAIPKATRQELLQHLLTFFNYHQQNFRGLKSLEILQEVLA
jgi:DNA repair protein RecO (recombination protein O)